MSRTALLTIVFLALIAGCARPVKPVRVTDDVRSDPPVQTTDKETVEQAKPAVQIPQPPIQSNPSGHIESPGHRALHTTNTPVPCPDFDGPPTVGMEDIQSVAGCWHGSETCVSLYDIAPEDPDGAVNILDIMKTVAAYGIVCAAEETPPAVVLRIDDREAAGSDELLVTPDWERMQQSQDLAFVSEKGQTVELWGSGALVDPYDLLRGWPGASMAGQATVAEAVAAPFRLRYDQLFSPAGQIVYLILLPETLDLALFAQIDTGAAEPIKYEVLPGFSLEQQLVPGAPANVQGAASTRYWLPVEVATSDGSWTLVGGQSAVVTHDGAGYQVHVYRSIWRTPGSHPDLPFEGEHYLLSATIIAQ